MDNSEIAKKIIAENNYMTIATSSNNVPWVTPVFYAFDEKYTFYWYSSKESVHSTNIKQNKQIAIVIFNSQATGDDVSAIYIKANAFEIIEDNELSLAAKLSFQRQLKYNLTLQKKMIKDIEDFKDDSPLRFYKALPKQISILNPSQDYHGKYVDSRSEVKQTTLR